MTPEAFIYDAVRTPRGAAKADGGLAGETPASLIECLLVALEDRTGFTRRDTARLTLGCVGQTGAQGGHIAMVAKMLAELPDEAGALTINNFCASGLTAIGLAAGCLETFPGLQLAGGVEMMSRVPFMADRADYYADPTPPLERRYIPVALAADLLALSEGVSREEMDRAALHSQQAATRAEANPALTKSRIACGGLSLDETVREVTGEGLAAMPPAFAALADDYAAALGDPPREHRMTVAHAPPMADGAGLALIGNRDALDQQPRARIVAFREAGGNPRQSLLAGFTAMKAVLAEAGMALSDMGRIEFMEAFAPTIVKLLRDYPVDPARVNVGGGHLAKGHPMGASGAILLSTLLDALDAAEEERGLVVLTGAQGVGAAMIVERLA